MSEFIEQTLRAESILLEAKQYVLNISDSEKKDNLQRRLDLIYKRLSEDIKSNKGLISDKEYSLVKHLLIINQ